MVHTISTVACQTNIHQQKHEFRLTIASTEQEAASTPVSIPETVSRCLLSLTQALGKTLMRWRHPNLIVLVASALTCLATVTVVYAKNEALFAKTVTYSYHLKIGLQFYEREMLAFPDSIEAMVAEGYVNTNTMQMFFPGTTVSYHKPATTDRPDFEVLVVEYKGRRIVFTKDWNRILPK
jgi:hypothetical protein